MRSLACCVTFAFTCAASACGSDDSGPGSLSGVWTFIDYEESASGAESVLIADKGDTVEMVRCGAQDLPPEIWTRDGDTLSPPAGATRGAGVVVNDEKMEQPDEDEDSERFGWSACRADTEQAFHAGSLSVTEGAETWVDSSADVCASRLEASPVEFMLSTYVDDALASLRFSATGDSIDTFSPREMRIDAAGVDQTNIDQTALIGDSTDPTALDASVQTTILLDGGARTFVWSVDVRFDAPDCD